MAIKDLLRERAKLFRRGFRRSVQMVRYGRISMQGVPIFFVNAFPKSGTHLLIQVIKGFTNLGPAVDSGLPAVVTFDGETGRSRHIDEILLDFERLLPGDIAYGHMHCVPQVKAFLCRDGIASFFLIRDPRDVVVSHLHYVTEMEPNHVHHDFYRYELSNMDERINASIMGRPELEIPFPNICKRFEPYLGWMNCSQVLVLRFEDFITDIEIPIVRILEHAVSCGFPLKRDRQESLELLKTCVDPESSPTYRSGKTGGWRTHFNEDHKKKFKEVAGDLLIDLGYEHDNDW